MAVSSILVKSFQVSALATAMALAGCGGGSGNDTLQPGLSNQSATVITQPVVLSNIILLDNNGANTTTITSAGAVAKIKVTDIKGNPITNGLVTFTGDAVKFSTTNGAVLTDANGIATIIVYPADSATTGAYSMKASIIAEGKTVTSNAINFEIKATPITQPVVLGGITLLDNNGANTTTITSAGAVAKIKVTDVKGNPITNGLVTFTGEAVKFGTTNSAVLTDSNGIATINVMPTDFNTSGAYSMTASVIAEGKTITSDPINYQIKSSTINLLGLTSDKTSLADAKDSANLSVKVQDGNTGTALAGVTVDLAASCGAISNTTTSNALGIVTAKYTPAEECVGKIVNITATNGAVTQSTMIGVAAARVEKSQLVYTTTGATVLAPIYSSNASDTSKDVQFNLFDSKGLPISGSVVVSLNDPKTAPSDFAFGASSNDTAAPSRTPITLTTDSNGILKVRLYPGTATGNVTLKVTLVSDPTVSTTSSNIVVANNLPSQDNFTFTSDDYSLSANGTTKLHVTLKNAQGVGVDNTTVNFSSEIGSVDATCNTDAAGNCTVNYTASATAPKDKQVTILAYVKDGLKGGYQLGSLFRDDNHDRLYSPNTDGFVLTNSPIDSTVTCTNSSDLVPNIANTCNNSTYAVLRKQIFITTNY